MTTATTAKRGSLRYYRELCQKGDSENFLFDKYVFRKISIFPTILFIKLGVQPNTATFLSLIAALIGCVCVGSPKPTWLLTGALFAFVYYTLDHVDGELARYYIKIGRREPSVSGVFFDSLVHSYSATLMLFSFGISIYHQWGYIWAIYLGFVACISASRFPDLVGSQTLAGAIIRRSEILAQASAREAVRRAEWSTAAVAAVSSKGVSLEKVKKAGRELFGFPGYLFMIIGASIADACWAGFEMGGVVVSGRLLVIAVLALAHGGRSIVNTRTWLRVLGPVR